MSKIAITIGIITFLIILVVLYLVIENIIECYGFQDGYTFSGILNGGTAPILGLLSCFLLFISFYIQYQANQIQRKELKYDRFNNQVSNELSEIKRQYDFNIKYDGLNATEAIDAYLYKVSLFHTHYEERTHDFVELSDLYIESENLDKIQLNYYIKELTQTVINLYYFINNNKDFDIETNKRLNRMLLLLWLSRFEKVNHVLVYELFKRRAINPQYFPYVQGVLKDFDKMSELFTPLKDELLI
ncbi:MAG: hypothetical protein HY951_09660 [Bacteroidia bacterium]|nr:hypothetical protein [Bacteroidia bacterium]